MLSRTRFLHPESDSYSEPGDKSEEEGAAPVLISEESYLEDCILPQAGINEATWCIHLMTHTLFPHKR